MKEEKVFDRPKPGWTSTYTSSDMGTERSVTIRNSEGKIIGQRDPFMAGIPINARRREARLRLVSREIIAGYDERMISHLSHF